MSEIDIDQLKSVLTGSNQQHRKRSNLRRGDGGNGDDLVSIDFANNDLGYLVMCPYLQLGVTLMTEPSPVNRSSFPSVANPQ